jgi:hypothetical protein
MQLVSQLIRSWVRTRFSPCGFEDGNSGFNVVCWVGDFFLVVGEMMMLLWLGTIPIGGRTVGCRLVFRLIQLIYQ